MRRMKTRKRLATIIAVSVLAGSMVASSSAMAIAAEDTTSAESTAAPGDTGNAASDAPAAVADPAPDAAVAVADPAPDADATGTKATPDAGATDTGVAAPIEPAAPVNGSPAASDDNPKPEKVDDAAVTANDVGVQDIGHGTLWASFDLSRVTLVDGAVTGTTRGQLSAVAGTISSSTKDAYRVSGTYLNDPTATGLDATVVYKIRMNIPNPPDEDYWLQTRVYVANGEAFAQCGVYIGDPRAGGAVPGAAFTCFVNREQGFPNVRYTFSVSLNRWEESSGTITTKGPMSLSNGHYYFDLPYRVAGDAVVQQNSSTRFATVMREADQPDEPGVALTRFSYKLLDGGGVTDFWIAGWVKGGAGGNYGMVCGVYDVDPSGTTAWVDLKTVAAAPYACATTGQKVDHGNFVATMTVSKRTATIITAADRPRQTAKYREVCSINLDNCDLKLGSAVETSGKARKISNIWENHDDKPQHHSFTVAAEQSITHTFGTEVTIGVEGGLGVKYKAEIKAKYELEIGSKTTTKDTVDYDIEPGDRAWIDGAPPMVHTEGDIYVAQGDRLFVLQGVIADFPNEGGKWVSYLTHEKIPGHGLGEPSVDPQAGSDSAFAGVNPAPTAAARTSTTTSAQKLAETGTSLVTELRTAAVAIAVIITGLLFFFRRRRRTRDHMS